MKRVPESCPVGAPTARSSSGSASSACRTAPWRLRVRSSGSGAPFIRPAPRSATAAPAPTTASRIRAREAVAQARMPPAAPNDTPVPSVHTTAACRVRCMCAGVAAPAGAQMMCVCNDIRLKQTPHTGDHADALIPSYLSCCCLIGLIPAVASVRHATLQLAHAQAAPCNPCVAHRLNDLTAVGQAHKSHAGQTQPTAPNCNGEACHRVIRSVSTARPHCLSVYRPCTGRCCTPHVQICEHGTSTAHARHKHGTHTAQARPGPGRPIPNTILPGRSGPGAMSVTFDQVDEHTDWPAREWSPGMLPSELRPCATAGALPS